MRRVPLWLIAAAITVFLATSAESCTDTGNGGGNNGNNQQKQGALGGGGGPTGQGGAQASVGGGNDDDFSAGASSGGGGSGGASGGCEAGYDPCVPTYPPDVDCPEVGGPVTVTGSDPHGLDADGDGSGCET